MAEENLVILSKYSGMEFFGKLEEYLNTPISNVLKNILKVNGMDSALILRDYSDKTVHEIETFIRNNFQRVMIDDSARMIDYSGVFEKYQKSFVLLPGQKILLNNVSTECKKLYKSEDGTVASTTENPANRKRFPFLKKTDHT